MFGSKFSTRKMLSLIPVILGVALALVSTQLFHHFQSDPFVIYRTYGDYYFTLWGLVLTLLGTFLAALKTIFTNVLQSTPSSTTTLSNSKPKSIFATLHITPPRLAMHPLDLLTRMCPLAFIQCVFYAWISDELKSVRDWSAHEMTWFSAAGLIMNGCIAFGLNIVSFTANKKAGALSMTVAGMFHAPVTVFPEKLIRGSLRSEHQTGVDHLVRCFHVQPAYHQHERRWNPVHAHRRSVVRVCGLPREEAADLNCFVLLACGFRLLPSYLFCNHFRTPNNPSL